MDCAICLNHIERKHEAYLYPCCHFFCYKCILEWTERQRRHPADHDCLPQQQCKYACPLCKAAYTYIVYDCMGSSCSLMPMCGQPKTMSAIPLTPAQSRRRALYVTPQQLTPVPPVPAARRPRSPTDKEVTAFVERDLQAILLTEDVEIIVQHVAGILHNMTKKPKARAANSSSSSPGLYGDQAVFVEVVSNSMHGFLNDHSKAFAEHLYAFLQSGLTVAGYDRLIFGSEEAEQTEELHDMMGEGAEIEAGIGQDW